MTSRRFRVSAMVRVNARLKLLLKENSLARETVNKISAHYKATDDDLYRPELQGIPRRFDSPGFTAPGPPPWTISNTWVITGRVTISQREFSDNRQELGCLPRAQRDDRSFP
ncbi:hypothetical protein PoB_000533300 [Plakobranchus ocellatus]|uniref:Uncharacterized protein n=1 Tax=Plakobranchus ocellatus TaxID=259542 RepID=A0AAV3Y8J5_9GAST|nr:hypothetical protein PoB_000533300 [Plakobranchus ocellatus]